MNINEWESMIPIGFFTGTGKMILKLQILIIFFFNFGLHRVRCSTSSFWSCCWIWMAITRGIHKFGLLLFGWSTTWSIDGLVLKQGVMGIWVGIIFGGTAIQTVTLAIITIRCNWEKKAIKASLHVQKWADM
ncbi:unnamed protein product [Coffea canephora]|uniref:DH200=94 genomic scaffold, scaffold_6691 n=1 Tax=Coffea canephora TaxID=49390 RepID=A0A068VPY8_COFCA|nr:unnamed protein product [Coffea canephora]